jgi:hypothetical protein
VGSENRAWRQNWAPATPKAYLVPYRPGSQRPPPAALSIPIITQADPACGKLSSLASSHTPTGFGGDWHFSFISGHEGQGQLPSTEPTCSKLGRTGVVDPKLPVMP